MRGSNQGGSLAGFIIIGAVLALVLIGGLYGLNRYNTEQGKQVAAKNEPAKKTTDDKKQNQGKQAQTPKPESNDKQPQPATNQPPKAGTKPETAQPTPATGQKTLPNTGPGDTLVQLIAVASLSFAAARYLKSLRYAQTR